VHSTKPLRTFPHEAQGVDSLCLQQHQHSTRQRSPSGTASQTVHRKVSRPRVGTRRQPLCAQHKHPRALDHVLAATTDPRLARQILGRALVIEPSRDPRVLKGIGVDVAVNHALRVGNGDRNRGSKAAGVRGRGVGHAQEQRRQLIWSTLESANTSNRHKSMSNYKSAHLEPQTGVQGRGMERTGEIRFGLDRCLIDA